jgi:hypothetical protein
MYPYAALKSPSPTHPSVPAPSPCDHSALARHAAQLAQQTENNRTPSTASFKALYTPVLPGRKSRLYVERLFKLILRVKQNSQFFYNTVLYLNTFVDLRRNP